MKKLSAVVIFSLVTIVVTPAPSNAAAKRYKSCKALRKDYPNGVRSTGPTAKVYALNKHLDRDKDGKACETKS